MADQAATGDCKWYQSEKSFGGSCPYVRSLQADPGHHPAACCRVRTLHQIPTSQYVQNLWVLIVLHTIQVPKSSMNSQGIKFWCSFWYKTYHHWIECYGLIIQVVRLSEGFFGLEGSCRMTALHSCIHSKIELLLSRSREDWNLAVAMFDRWSASLGKYCLKRLPSTCTVVIVDHGKVIFDRKGTQIGSPGESLSLPCKWDRSSF